MRSARGSLIVFLHGVGLECRDINAETVVPAVRESIIAGSEHLCLSRQAVWPHPKICRSHPESGDEGKRNKRSDRASESHAEVYKYGSQKASGWHLELALDVTMNTYTQHPPSGGRRRRWMRSQGS
jgi:hypothetical protein